MTEVEAQRLYEIEADKHAELVATVRTAVLKDMSPTDVVQWLLVESEVREDLPWIQDIATELNRELDRLTK